MNLLDFFDFDLVCEGAVGAQAVPAHDTGDKCLLFSFTLRHSTLTLALPCKQSAGFLLLAACPGLRHAGMLQQRINLAIYNQPTTVFIK